MACRGTRTDISDIPAMAPVAVFMILLGEYPLVSLVLFAIMSYLISDAGGI
jgi:hypothetical protein